MPAYYLEVAVLLLGFVLLLADAFVGGTSKKLIAYVGIAGLAAIFAGLFFAVKPAGAEDALWNFYSVDRLALFYKGLAVLATIIVLVMATDYSSVVRGYLHGDGEAGEAGLGEFYYLPLFTCAGLMWMASATDLIGIFVALELVTISFYVLVAFMRRNVGSLEAGVKYLILGALSTGFFVFGIAWVFGATGGQTHLDAIGAAIGGSEVPFPMALKFGLAMLLVAIGFKVAAAPFQLWVPDVYQGAPTPVTAFLSVGSKAAGFIVAYRILMPFVHSTVVGGKLVLVLLIMAVATILYGNLAAIPQTNLKRLFAYSSISHAGFILLAFAAAGSEAARAETAIAVYLAAYLIMTLLGFMVLCLVRVQTGSDQLKDYDGLGQRSPLLAFALAASAISLVGIPLTVGFVGKLHVFTVAWAAGHYLPLIVALIGVAASFYYYFKIIRAVYIEKPSYQSALNVPFLSRCVMIVLVVLVFVLGVYPRPILSLLGA